MTDLEKLLIIIELNTLFAEALSASDIEVKNILARKWIESSKELLDKLDL